VRPILSATDAYNYAPAKWLDDKLKPQSCNRFTVTDTFRFADEVRGLEIKTGEMLVSYDATSLFTNVPLEETIQILAEKAFVQYWFNKTHGLNLSKTDLVDLLRAASKNSFSYLTVLCTNRRTESLWALSLARCWITPSCARFRKTSNNTVNFPDITEGTSMTP